MKILVIIVTYNGMRWIERCIASVLESGVKADLFVVDNGSTDGTRQYLNNCKGIIYSEAEENLGFGAANNLGFEYAIKNAFDYVYLLNQDAWLEKETLKQLLSQMEAKAPSGKSFSAEYGILSPLQKDANGELDRNFEKKCGKYLNNRADIVDVPFVMAAHWMMTVDCIRLVGGFSPVFKQYGEDDNYIDRLHYNGLKCGILQTASAVHDRASRKSSRESRMKLKTVSSLVRLSDPSNCYIAAFCIEILRLVGMSIKNFSSVPLKNIKTIFKRKSELKRCRGISKTVGAFL